MNEFEKDVIRLLEVHERAGKEDLIVRINEAIRNSGIKRKGKNEWICKVTGSPMGTVCKWFAKSKVWAANKIPVYAMCKIAVALDISVWSFFDLKSAAQEIKKPEIDRRGKLYWHLRRNEAEQLWNSSYGYRGEWGMQSKAIQREFLDKLYLEKVAEQPGKEIG